MALGSTQPLTEISTRDISWGKGGRCVGLTTLQLCLNFKVRHWFVGQAVAQLVKALSYKKPEGRGFDSRWCH